MSNRFKFSIACFVAALVVAGCSNKPDDSNTSGKPSDSKSTTGTDSTAALPKDGSATKGTDKPDASKPDATKPTDAKNDKGSDLKIPDDVKTEALDYYGLTNSNPIDYTLKSTGKPDKSGARIFKLTKVENGNAYFTQTNTGGLSEGGDFDIMANKKGVFVVRAATITMKEPQMEIPATPKPGDKWHTKSSLEDTDYTVVGFKKIKTSKGEQDALYITGSGTITVNGSTVPTESKFWCVKGLGQVKVEFQTHPKSKDTPSQHVVMEEVKP